MKVIYIAHGNYNLLSRAKKQVTSLYNNNYDVTVLNGLFGNDPEYIYPYSILKLKIGTSKYRLLNFAFVIIYLIKVFTLGKRLSPEIVVCRELTNLPAGVFLRVFTKCKLVFDSNEISVATHSGVGKIVWGWIENHCLRYCDTVIQANIERGEAFVKMYPHRKLSDRICIIPNYPSFMDAPKRDIVDKTIHAVYFGSIDIHRGIEELVDAVKDMPEIHLDIIGFGSPAYITKLESYLKDNSILNISLLGPINDSDTNEVFRKYSIGIAFYPNVNLNNWLCAPNKVWQYIHARLAPLTTANPPLVRVIKQADIGECIENITQESLHQAIKRIVENRLWENIREDFIINHSWQFIEGEFLKLMR